MKSILQEANSIERAIDKAWNQAGKPKEFTIKVLDEGERNFLGLSRRPAIVTILYKPEKITNPQQPRTREDRPRDNERRESRGNNGPRVHDNSRRQEEQRPRRYTGTEEQRTAFNTVKNEGWRDEWKDFVVSEIRELLKHMGIGVGIDAQVSGDKLLTISFAQAVLDNEEEQRMLFATLSYLAIQLLKRTYKSRFIGYRIAVTGPKADGSSMSADSDEPMPRTFEPRGSHTRRDAGQSPQAQAPQSRESREEGGQRSSGGGRERSERGGDRRPRRERSDRDRQLRNAAPTQYANEHVSTSSDHADDIIADQMRFAQQQLSKEEGRATSVDRAPKAPSMPPLKKDSKYQPFFVLEDEESK